MIIMNLKLDNILAFSNFEINFSYPMKLRKSTIENENLEYLPSFRYKKMNIFVGSNASGKTSLIKSIWKILLFLSRKERNYIDELVNRKYNEANIEVDLVDKRNNKENVEYSLIRVKILYNNQDNSLKMAYFVVKLNNGDSYESRVQDLNNAEYHFDDYLECLKNFNYITDWHTTLPATEQGFERISFISMENVKDLEEYLFTMNQVLKTLDPSILNVKRSRDTDDAYVIEHDSFNKIIIQSGNKLSSINNLSSGTKYGINITNIIYSIKKHMNGIYLVDEQFSYVNSDIEMAMISTISTLLGSDEQLFITTHNSNILQIRFPFHSFNFMSKENIHGKTVIISQCGSIIENRNNVSAKSILDNDMLATAPDVNKIYELGEKK